MTYLRLQIGAPKTRVHIGVRTLPHRMQTVIKINMFTWFEGSGTNLKVESCEKRLNRFLLLRFTKIYFFNLLSESTAKSQDSSWWISPKVVEFWKWCVLLWAHFDSWRRTRCRQAFFPGAHLCNEITAVSYDLYMH